MRLQEAGAEAAVLVLDEDALQLELTALLLERDGHRPITTTDADAALRILADDEVDVVVMEAAYVRHDGFMLGRRIRESRPLIGIVVASRWDEEDQVIRSLFAFADDYVAKPFSPRELQARVRAVLRRSQVAREPRAAEADLVAGDLVVHRAQMQATVRGVAMPLTPREISLLVVMMTKPNRVLSRGQLIGLAWGDQFEGAPKAVDVYVQRLRKKLGRGLPAGCSIDAVRGVGYMLSTVRRRPPARLRYPAEERALAV